MGSKNGISGPSTMSCVSPSLYEFMFHMVIPPNKFMDLHVNQLIGCDSALPRCWRQHGMTAVSFEIEDRAIEDMVSGIGFLDENCGKVDFFFCSMRCTASSPVA